MVQPTVKRRILADLDRPSPEQQQRAAELAHGLVSPLPTGASIEDLLQVAGTLDEEAARQMMEAIEEGCERVDLDEWQLPLIVHDLATAKRYGSLKAELLGKRSRGSGRSRFSSSPAQQQVTKATQLPPGPQSASVLQVAPQPQRQ